MRYNCVHRPTYLLDIYVVLCLDLLTSGQQRFRRVVFALCLAHGKTVFVENEEQPGG
jgi:hypothetical protein